jgi:Sec-independent protein translocase protein TatA
LLGPSGGFFGVGSSEVLVIGVVAYFILGPKRLYQLARDIGRISAEFKNVTEEAKLTFQKAVDIDVKEKKEEPETIEIKKALEKVEILMHFHFASICHYVVQYLQKTCELW